MFVHLKFILECGIIPVLIQQSTSKSELNWKLVPWMRTFGFLIFSQSFLYAYREELFVDCLDKQVLKSFELSMCWVVAAALLAWPFLQYTYGR